MIVGAYSLDLYCDNEEKEVAYFGQFPPDPSKHDVFEFPHQYTGETKQGCIRKARNDGWLINYKENKALCPKCSKKKRRV